MEQASALGPIDAQIIQGGKRFSAHAFLEGLKKIKEEIEEQGHLNRAYVPILQNISPGEIQNCENALSFAKTLVTEWLSKYKFKFWKTHSSTGEPVMEEEKRKRAQEIAEILPGRPEESHLQSPTDPYVSLSTHTARASLPLETSQPQADIERLGSSQLPG